MSNIKVIFVGITIITVLTTIQQIQNIHTQQKLSNEEIFKNSENSIVGIIEKYDKSRHNDDIEYDGTGFVYKKDGNILGIVTNEHVIRDESESDDKDIRELKKVKVGFNDGSVYTGKILGADYEEDIAILELVWNSTRSQQPPPEPLVLGNSSELKVGQEVLAIGNPFYGCDKEVPEDGCEENDDSGQTFFNLVTSGVIGKLDVYITDTEPPPIPNAIVTDALIAGGSSGGPLLNMQGEVIGITTAGGYGTCCTYAITSNTAIRVIEELSSR